MPGCKHESLEFMGEQKTDDGVNSYYRCRSCQSLLVMMPSRKVIGIPGLQGEQPSGDGAEPS